MPTEFTPNQPNSEPDPIAKQTEQAMDEALGNVLRQPNDAIAEAGDVVRGALPKVVSDIGSEAMAAATKELQANPPEGLSDFRRQQRDERSARLQQRRTLFRPEGQFPRAPRGYGLRGTSKRRNSDDPQPPES